MASKRHGSTTTGKRGSQPVASSRIRLYLAIAGSVLAGLALVAIGFVALNGSGSSPASGLAAGETIHQGTGGTWTNVTPDRLAQMLQNKDFTFVNVKTPYSSEIDRTDLYIPYDQLTARVSQLPAAKNAKILVYCRSGAESAQAAQSLLALGYTNVWNLEGGMTAWQSSGRSLVNKNRT